MKLSFRIMLGVGILLILSFGGTGYWIFNSEMNLLIQQTHSEIITINKIFLEMLHELMLANRIDELHRLYQNLKEVRSISEVRVIHGESVDKQFGTPNYERAIDKLEINALREGKNQYKYTRNVDNPIMRSINVIKAEKRCLKCHHANVGDILGAISVTISLKEMEKIIKRRHVTLFILTFSSIFLVIGVLYLLLNYLVLSKVRELVRANMAVGQGNLDTLVEIESGDEMQELGDSFNDMTTKLKNAQESLIQTEKLAAIGRLGISLTHEINNPIGIIISRIDCMESDLKTGTINDTNQIKEDLNIIKKHAHRISNLTNVLLSFTRKSDSRYILLNLSKLIDETVMILEKDLACKNIVLKKSIDNSIQIRGNKNELQQVIINLLSNASDSMFPSGGKITIESSVFESIVDGNPEKFIHLKISDQGEGISSEHLDKIFEPFFSTKEIGKGTGLGLSIAYHIVKNHGGKITVENEQEKGVTFIVTLPIYETR